MIAIKRYTSLLITLTALVSILALVPAAVGQGACNGTTLQLQANQTASIITSPNDPNNYTNSTNCEWTITAASSSQVVGLTALAFPLGGTFPACPNGYVSIIDGGIYDDVIKSFCGQSSSEQFISTGQSMSFVFHSGEQNNFRGFKFEYISIEKSELCGNTTLSAIGVAKNFSSPGYPYNYPNFMDCQWTITADSASSVVALDFLDLTFESDCYYGYVYINDGPISSFSPRRTKLCGQGSTYQLLSADTLMTVSFYSGRGGSSRRFLFEYASQQKSELCGNGSLVGTGLEQYIVSPGYPYNYPNLMNCQWVITADDLSDVVVLKLKSFYLETSSLCLFDNVTLYDGNSTSAPIITTLCGSVLSGQYSSSGSTVTVVFRSDSSNSNLGFKLEYTTQDKSSLCASRADLSANSSAQFYTSPNYPFDYLSDTDCQWHITTNSSSHVIVLTLLDFYLEGTSTYCSSAEDYVALYDGSSTSFSQIQKLCGLTTSGEFISSGSALTVQFHTDGSVTHRGFKFQYISMNKSALCAANTLTASSIISYLSSPNYPGLYPNNLDCQWHITADPSSNLVVLDLNEFSLEGYGSSCYRDYVVIYDGPSTTSSQIETLCGNEYYGSYKSTGSEMTVVFHSDGISSTNKGFRFTYRSQKKTEYSSPLSPGAISAIVICSIAVPFLIVVFLTVLVRRNATQKQTRSRVAFQNGRGTAGPVVTYVANNPQAVPDPYAVMQNPQMMNTGNPGYNMNYPPPPYSSVVQAGAAPQGQPPILNNPVAGPSMDVAPTQDDGGHLNKGFIS